MENAQQLIDDLWSDMAQLGWEPSGPPVMPDVKNPWLLRPPDQQRALWRAFQSALSQAQRISRQQMPVNDVHTPVAGDDFDEIDGSTLAETESERNLIPGAKPELSKGNPKLFEGGELVFHQDRVTLCGVDICSGTKSPKRRRILELLSECQPNGTYVSYSARKLAAEVSGISKQGTIIGAIRDLRKHIVGVLREQSNLACGLREVVLSAGRGYRLASCLSVHFEESPGSSEITDITDMSSESDVRNVPNQDVPNVRNDDDLKNAPEERRAWILRRLEAGHGLQAPIVADQFGCHVKTAQRDLQALKDEGRIEFVGATRTGHYRLQKGSKDAHRSGGEPQDA